MNQDAALCLSDQNNNCIYDFGSICNTTNLKYCNILNNSKSCLTLDMITCIKGYWIPS